MENTKGFTNSLVQEFLETKVNETSPIVIKPIWVGSTTGDNINTIKIPPVVFSIPPTINAIQYMTDGTEDQDYVDYISSQYSLASNNEKIKILYPFMLSQFRYNLIYDDNIFRLVGPANTMVGADLTISDTDPCVIYGGCRMLTCVDFENQYDDGDYVDLDADETQNSYGHINWFKGSCNFCHNTIPYPHYAVRKPILYGGWQGCFCSWECVQNSLLESESPILALIPQFQNQLLTIGIQERNLVITQPEEESDFI